MSSILDALNKLEQEKVQAANEEDFGGHIDPEQAAKELLGDDAPGERPPLKLTPAAMLLGAALAMAVMVATSAGVTMLVMRSQAPPAAIASAAQPPTLSESPATPPVPEPAPAIVAKEAQIEVPPAPAVEEAPAPPAPVTPEPVAEAPAVAKVEETEIVTPPPAPKPAPAVVQEKPPPVQVPAEQIAEIPPPVREEPLRVARSEPIEDTPAAKPEAPLAPAVATIRALPHLTAAVAQRYSSGPILLNMVSPATANRPYGYAIIDRVKVTEGERIGDSRFRLTDIESHGVAVEAAGDRYYIPF